MNDAGGKRVYGIGSDLNVDEACQVVRRVRMLAQAGAEPSRIELRAQAVRGKISPTPALGRALADLVEGAQ